MNWKPLITTDGMGLSGMEVFIVHVPANVYAGKWYDYRTVPVYVYASSKEQASTIVNQHQSLVLSYLDKKRIGRNGKRLVMKGKGIERNVFFKPNYYVSSLDPFGLIGSVLTSSGYQHTSRLS